MSFHYNYYRNETCHKHLPWCCSWQHHELICHIQRYIGRFQHLHPSAKISIKLICKSPTCPNVDLKPSIIHCSNFCIMNSQSWWMIQCTHLIYYKINSTNSKFIVPISNQLPIFMQGLLFQQLEWVFYDAHS
jgi:hypothetical protein